MAKETANNGFIFLHRVFMDWQHYGEPAIKAVFLDLLLNANHKAGWWRGHLCERGATFMSIRTIAENNGIAINTAQRALKVLEETGEIRRVRIDQKHTKTIVCKYNEYQSVSEVSVSNRYTQTDTQTDTKTDTQTDTKQECNNDNNIVIVEEKQITHAHEENLVEQMLAMPMLLDPFLMHEHISREQFANLANIVVAEWKLIGKTHLDSTDERKHLFAHIRRKVNAMREQGTLMETTDKNTRLAPLIEDCKALIAEGFPRDKVAEFYAYWTQECTDHSGRMLFETMRAWDTRTRFLKNYKKTK